MTSKDTNTTSEGLSRVNYVISKEEEKVLLEGLRKRTDIEAKRIQKYLDMADLSRTEGSPLNEIMKRVTTLPLLKEFDHIDIPEVIPTNILFDLFNFAADHPARSKSDTYYVDEKNVLRTHDTVMWYYYLNLPEIKQKIAEKKALGVMCYGKVYRKDEIDRHHMNIFHQMGGLYLVPNDQKVLTLDDLKAVLSEIVQAAFGKDTKFRFNVDTFPYTDPSLEVEVEINGKWIEILGGGMPRPTVLKEFGIEGYNGWAFGFGLERLAIISLELPDIRLLWSDDERVKKQLKLGNKFVEVSKYPPIVRDISFIVKSTFIPNDYFDLVRETGGELIEEVHLLDKYENEAKFGKDNISYAYRITYRSLDRTLTAEEIDTLHKKIEGVTKETFGATIR
ncbi:MAG: Phenylalanine--tRNA ligase [Patescibacteria group bacterium]|nr:Phenylalanine--tRNA ligase [Patescibacteria group bacterium]